jgi:hypothetical protein
MIRVLLDANVLFSEPLRRLLLSSAQAGVIQPHWTLRILDEACGSLVKTGRETGPGARALHTRLLAEYPAALVTGYEPLTDRMANHPGDRHVAAAAAHAGVPLIVTKNLHDFRKLPEGLTAISPDALLLQLLAQHATAMEAVLAAAAAQHGGRDASLAEMKKIVPRFAKRLRERQSSDA